MTASKVGEILQIDSQTAWDFIKDKHYAGRRPNIFKAFGWYIGGELVAVCTFGKPATGFLCRGICGIEYSSNVYELNRLVRVDWMTEPLSCFLGGVLKRLKKENWIVVSYSDTGMNHHGYIYQACNFLYTGKTRQRTDPYSHGKHARHTSCDKPGELREVRTSKHRYIYFCTNSKKLRKKWREALNYEVLPYPKGDNSNYRLGDVYYPALVNADKSVVDQGDKLVMRIETR